MSEQLEWNVVFLLDANPLTRVVLLKRAADKKFAPNFYTGVGGKLDPGETADESAQRETYEETGILTQLTQFARCVIDHKYTLYYYWGIYPHDTLPETTDGELEWVEKDRVLDKDIIPTTKVVCQEWSNRRFEIARPFTLYVSELGLDRGVRLVGVKQIKEGLRDIN